MKNNGDDTVSYYFISVGKDHKLFTHNLFNSRNLRKPESYIKTLSSNLVEAVEKAIESNPNYYNMIDEAEVFDRNEKKSWKFIPFGKFKGRHIDEIIVEAPDYVLWMFKNNNEYKDKGGQLGKLGKYIENNIHTVFTTVAKLKEKKAEKLVETTTTQHLGTIGEKEKRNSFEFLFFI